MNPDNPQEDIVQPVVPVTPEVPSNQPINDLTNQPAPVNFPPPPVLKKSSHLMLIAIVLVVVALLAVIAYVLGMQFLGQKQILPVSPKACTAEAKICPDGSSVGRTGPNCEFAECPEVSATPDPTADWKTYSNSFYNYEIKYPERFYSTNIADGSSGPALSNSLMVALIDKETPPVGSVTIQVFQLKPSYPSSLTKSQGLTNGLSYEKYSQPKSDTYLFTSEDKKRYVEILVDYNPDVDYKEVFDQILSTFQFTN